ncbi:TonB-dependent receptor [Caulobacter sp. SSI4214]|uniref:TonB-dependent receptor plug domain-containing protein n=1 Tax=Caulobacter sp. SSI4214 TaxID=2575739 RepID=UPI00143C1B91|nr:TonB-dependent receptor [Caulobacter sp. SSI4214]
MTRTQLLATAAVFVVAGAALAGQATAQTTTPAPAPTAEADQSGVLVFTPDFFAANRPNTAQDMVNRIPGFSINDGAQTRGFEGAVGNVLINGNRPASKNDTGSNVLSRTPASQVERIELVRGGAAGIDMQGYAMVANVILKKGVNTQQILTWNAQIFDGGHDVYGGSYQFTANNGDHSWGVLLSDGTSSSDSNGTGRTVRRDAAGNLLRDTAYSNDGWGGSNSIRLNYSGPFAGGKLEATARYGIHDWQEWQQDVSATSFNRTAYSEDTKFGEVGLTYIRPLAPTWTLETRAIHSFDTFRNASTGAEREDGVASPFQKFTSKGDDGETILRTLVRNERSPDLTLEGGGEVAYNMLDTKQAYTEDGVDVPLPSASVKVEELRGEAFAKAVWRIGPKLNLESQVRLETSTIKQSGDASAKKSFFYAKPRVLLTWTPSPASQVRVRFERELGQLDFNDFAASASLSNGQVYGGNVDLRPEQRWISEVGYERRFWGQGVVSVTYRHDEIIGVIDRLPLPGGLAATGNIGDGTLDKLSVNIVVPTDKLGVGGGRITFKNDWNDSHVTDPTTGRKRPISRVRPTQADIGFQQDLPRWKTQWGFDVIPLLGQGTYDPDQTYKWRGTGYYSAFAEYKPTPSLAIRAQINVWNDFRQRYVVYADRTPARPVSFVEDREINPRTFWTLRVRKTF